MTYHHERSNAIWTDQITPLLANNPNVKGWVWETEDSAYEAHLEATSFDRSALETNDE